MKKVVTISLFVVVLWLFLGIKLPERKEVVNLTDSVRDIDQTVDIPVGEATNSEGNLKLVGISRKSSEGSARYSIKVVNSQDRTERPLYETSVDPGSSITIPLNSWSPDYKEVFITIHGPDGEDYYLFKASGEDFRDGKKYVDIGEYWQTAGLAGRIRKISGWAGDDLLVTYTTKTDGSDGPAYWFVTGSRKFIQVREF